MKTAPLAEKLKSVAGIVKSGGGRASHTGKAFHKFLTERKRRQRRKGGQPTMASQKRKILGRYILADPKICHGKPTFVGTRIMVRQILRQVAKGKSWDAIVKSWGGRVSREGIAEAVALAERIFEDHAVEYGKESLTV